MLLWSPSSLPTFSYFILVLTFASAGSSNPEKSDNDHEVLCRRCGRETADAYYLMDSHLSPFDSRKSNLTKVFGKEKIPLQRLKNPHGNIFDCVLFKASGCIGMDKWSSEATWFPGYAWKACVCPQCGSHLGWMFEPEDELEDDPDKPGDLGFYALILDKLIDEEYASSMLKGVKLS